MRNLPNHVSMKQSTNKYKSLTKRLNSKVVLGILIILPITYLFIGYFLVPPFIGCKSHSLAGHAPAASFTFSYDNETGELTVTHDGGATITGDQTEWMEVSVGTENYGDYRATYGWEENGGTFPVEPGDSITITDRQISDGDRVELHWSGDATQEPSYCPGPKYPHSATLGGTNIGST